MKTQVRSLFEALISFVTFTDVGELPFKSAWFYGGCACLSRKKERLLNAETPCGRQAALRARNDNHVGNEEAQNEVVGSVILSFQNIFEKARVPRFFGENAGNSFGPRRTTWEPEKRRPGLNHPNRFASLRAVDEIS
jgi:hypothetical protein